MDLSNTERRGLWEALCHAFPTRAALTRMLDFQLNVSLERISGANSLDDVAHDVIQWARAQGRFADLLAGATAENPNNPELRAFTAALPLTGAAPPPPSILTAAAPATVALIHAPADAAMADALAQVLRQRGLWVLRESADLPPDAAAPIGEALATLSWPERITRGCDAAVLYLGPHGEPTDLMRHPAVAAAFHRHQQEPLFPILPVVQGIALSAIRPGNATWPPLAAFQPLILADDAQTAADLRVEARRILRATLARRVARDENHSAMTLALATFPDPFLLPPDIPQHLRLDWRSVYPVVGTMSLPPSNIWRHELLPALADTRDAVVRHNPGSGVDVWLKAKLPAALAFGYLFPHTAPVQVRWHRKDQGTPEVVWAYRPSTDQAPNLELTNPPLPEPLAEGAIVVPELTLEVTVTRAVKPGVERWLEAATHVPGLRLHAGPKPPLIPGIILTDEAHALAWLCRIRDRLRYEEDTQRVEALHIFVSSTVEFAALLGQVLYDRRGSQHPIHVYQDRVEDKQTVYDYVFTLDEAGLQAPAL